VLLLKLGHEEGDGTVFRTHCTKLFCNDYRDKYALTLTCSMSVHYIIQKILITNKCTKSFFIYCNTLLHVSTLLGHLQGELSVVVTLRLHYTVERERAVDCVLCIGGVNSLWSRLYKPGPQTVHTSKTTQCTVNSTFPLNCMVQP
jgi:hypothetical protein